MSETPTNLTDTTPDTAADWLAMADRLYGEDPQEGAAFARLGAVRMLLHGGRAHLRDLLAEVERLTREREEARELVAELADTDECRYDHHGYCQAHSLAERPCPHERANEAIAEWEGATREVAWDGPDGGPA